MMSGQRIEEVVPTLVKRREEGTGGGKRKTLPLQEGNIVTGKERTSGKKMETAAPKVWKKRGEPAEDGGDGRRRRKPKAIVEVNSTFTELRRLLQEMRPSTLQVLKTPYYRNCKAARNMRKGVRQIRDFCKQVRLETVMLAKKKQGEEMSRKRRKPEVALPAAEGPEEVPKKKRKVTPPPELGDEVSKKKRKSEVPAVPLEDGEEAPRKRKKPEVATPPLEEDLVDDGIRGEAEPETPPLDAAIDDESTRELEVATPPLDASLDDENEDE